MSRPRPSQLQLSTILVMLHNNVNTYYEDFFKLPSIIGWKRADCGGAVGPLDPRAGGLKWGSAFRAVKSRRA